MPLGEEVGDAYIEVHADTSSFRRELQREAKAAGAAAGRDFGDGMDSELDTQMSRLGRRLRQSLTEAGAKSGIGFQDGLEDAVASRMKRFTANLQDSMVSGDWTRVLADFDSLDKGIDAVESRLLSLRYQGAITEDQFEDAAKSLERWFSAVKNDEAEQAVKRITADINGFGQDFAQEAERVNRELEKLGKSRAARKLKQDLDLADFEAQMGRINTKAFRDFERNVESSATGLKEMAESSSRVLENFSRNRGIKRLKRDLDLSNFEAQVKRINDDYMVDFAENVEDVHQGLRKMVKEGKELGDALEIAFRKKRLQFDIDSSNWDKAFEEAGKSAEQFQAKLVLDGAEAEAKITENLRREYRERMELNEDFINDRAEFWDREVSRAVDSEKALRRWARNAEKEMTRLRKSLMTSDMDWLDTEALDRSLNRFADNVDRSFSRAGQSIDRGFIGRLKGARNDFANLVGVVGGGLEKVFIKGFDKAFGAAGRAVENLGSKITDLGGPFDRIGGAVQTFGSSIQTMSGGPIGQLVVTLAGFGLTLQFLVPILGTAVAGIYGLSGAIVALGVSLGGAALGALLSLGPMLLAVGAGAGAAVIGIMGMTDAMKDSLDPLKEWFDEVKTAVAERLFANLEEQVEGVRGLLERLTPTLEKSADVLSGFMDEFIAAFSSAEMQAVLAPLEDLLPQILDNLLGLVTNLSTAFSGMFAAIAPTVEVVTGKIEDAAGAFSEWVNSADGQTAIKDFFDKAATAAESLWDIAGAVWDVLKVLFEEGNATGQEFLDKIVALTTQFAEWLGSDEGRAELAEWFEYAKDVASELGDVVSSLKDLWDELNTPLNRQLFLTLLQGAEGLIDGLSRLAGWVDDVSMKFAAFIATVQNIDLAQGLSNSWLAVQTWWNGTVVPWFQAIPSTFKTVFSTAWEHLWSPVTERWSKVVAWWNTTALPWFQGLPAKFQSALQQAWDWLWKPVTERWSKVVAWWNSTALPWFQSLPGKVKSYFTNLWNQFPNEIAQAWGKVKSWWNNTALPWFRNLPSNVRNVGVNIINSMLDGIKDTWYKITNWLSNAVRNIRLTIPTPSINMPNLPWNARGSIVNGAQVVGVGEAGPEAIVPLNRNLSQVDPSVRWLSAIAQGKSPIPGAGSGGGTTIAEGAIQVFSNFADSRLVAEDVLSGLVSKFK